MKARRWWQVALWGTLAGALALGLRLFFRDSEPARTALELVDVACGASPAERLRILTTHVEEPLQVEIDGSGVNDDEPTDIDRLQAGLSPRRARAKDASSAFTWTQAELALQLVELNTSSPSCRLSLHDYSFQPGIDGSEWLVGDLDFTASQSEDLPSERRRVHAKFRHSGDDVRLERLQLGPVERVAPDAP